MTFIMFVWNKLIGRIKNKTLIFYRIENTYNCWFANLRLDRSDGAANM